MPRCPLGQPPCCSGSLPPRARLAAVPPPGAGPGVRHPRARRAPPRALSPRPPPPPCLGALPRGPPRPYPCPPRPAPARWPRSLTRSSQRRTLSRATRLRATCKARTQGAELQPRPAPARSLRPRPPVPPTYRPTVREAAARENGAEAAPAQLRAQLVELLQLLLLPCKRPRARRQRCAQEHPPPSARQGRGRAPAGRAALTCSLPRAGQRPPPCSRGAGERHGRARAARTGGCRSPAAAGHGGTGAGPGLVACALLLCAAGDAARAVAQGGPRSSCKARRRFLKPSEALRTARD